MCRRGDSAEVIAGTSGRAIPDVEVRIVEPGGAEVPRGEAGEVVVRGYNVMRGYFNDPEASEQAVDPAGWLHTGDIGTMDEDGNVAITDRLKDMYVSGGFNVYPAEVEAVLRGHPAVGQVAVIGIPDRRMGEVGLALVVPAADAGSLGEDELDRLGPGAPGKLQGAPVGAVGGRAPDECRGQGAQARAPTPVRAVGGRRMSARPHSGSVGGRPSVGCHSNRRNRQEREGCRARHRLYR